jgi:hypothetical protein
VELDGILQGNIPTSGGTLTISSLTAGTYILEIIDNNGCEKFEIIDCTFGCGFTISVELANCVVTMTVTEI